MLCFLACLGCLSGTSVVEPGETKAWLLIPGAAFEGLLERQWGSRCPLWLVATDGSALRCGHRSARENQHGTSW